MVLLSITSISPQVSLDQPLQVNWRCLKRLEVILWLVVAELLEWTCLIHISHSNNNNSRLMWRSRTTNSYKVTAWPTLCGTSRMLVRQGKTKKPILQRVDRVELERITTSMMRQQAEVDLSHVAPKWEGLTVDKWPLVITQGSVHRRCLFNSKWGILTFVGMGEMEALAEVLGFTRASSRLLLQPLWLLLQRLERYSNRWVLTQTEIRHPGKEEGK